MTSTPLYIGFDLSTQQLKAVVVDNHLKVQHIAKFDFDADSTGFNIKNGVLVNEALHEVYAPVALWLQALDGVLQQLKDQGLRFSDVRTISGAGQQHGSVYWNYDAADILQCLNPSEPLQKQVERALSHPYSPNWQDSSTQAECDLFDRELAGEEELAQMTGSKAHHRFTGPQILRFRNRNPDTYRKTARISLVSSFLASIFLGSVAPIDISDVCGMNLWDLTTGVFDHKLLSLASKGDAQGLADKLGPVYEDGGKHLGTISKYFVSRWGFSESCSITPFTGDNPATILALPLRPLDAMVSLGTSTTFLMSTPHYRPHPAVHFFNHPTTPGLYMFMLCFKNGGLAREQIRDAINHASNRSIPADDDIWSLFNQQASSTPIINQTSAESDMRLGLYFPRPEIVPNVSAGIWRYEYSLTTKALSRIPADVAGNTNLDARTIIESQFLSIRLRSKDIVEPVNAANGSSLPAQPRRIYLVGGGSKNAVITQTAGEVLGGSEGVWKLDVGDNACALGAAYKAVWAAERNEGETFEQLIGARWDESAFATKVGSGYDRTVFEAYGRALEGFERMEQEVVLSMNNSSSK